MAVRMGGPANTLAERAIKAAQPYLDPPEHRRGDADFCEAWTRIVQSYDPGYLIPADLEVVENYVAIGLEIRATEALLEREGKTFVVKGTGDIKPHPMLKALPAMYTSHKGYARLLRVGPATRSMGNQVKLSQLSRETLRPKGAAAAAQSAPKSVIIPMAGKK